MEEAESFSSPFSSLMRTVFAVYGDALAIVLGQDSFVVGELAGELARGQQARADAEVERGFIFGKVDRLGVCTVEQRFQLVHGFLGDEGFHLARDAVEFFAAALNMREAMAVGGDHGDGLRLEHHQCAVQGVTGFFVGDGESSLGDHPAQHLSGNLYNSRSRKCRQAGEIGASHADHLGIRPSTANTDPMIFKKFYGDISIGKQLDVIMQLSGRDGARAFFLHFRATSSAQAEIQIGCSQGELVTGSFE